MIKMCRLKMVMAKVFVVFLLSCLGCTQKGGNEIEIVDNGTKLVFNISEDDSNGGAGQMKVMSALNNTIVEDRVVGEEQHVLLNNGTMRLTASLVETSARMGGGRETVKTTFAGNRADVRQTKAQTVLPANVKYRVVLYDRATTPSTFVSSTLGTAGTPLSIDVVKGKNYDWAVFSYNDANDPGTSNTTVPSDQRDLLHINGTTGVIPGAPGDGTNVNVPINAVLKHKLAAITVELNSTAYPATITAAVATLGSANYFSNANMDVKTGTLSTATASTVATPINLTPTTPAAVRSATYYTASTSTIGTFSVVLNSLSILTQTNQVKTQAAPVTFNWGNVVPVAGRRYVAKINIQPVRDISGNNFRILSTGAAPYMFYNNSVSGLWQTMHSASNFGPTGKVGTTNLNWNITVRGSGSGSLSDANTGNYKMIFVGYATGLTSNDVVQLQNFINGGGTVIFFTENPGSGTDQSFYRYYVGNNTSYSGFSTFGNFTQDPVLNGPFGDARGTSFGNQSSIGYGLINYTASSMNVLAYADGSSSNAVAWKSWDSELFYFGDGGMLYTNGPFMISGSPGYVPQIASWSGRGNVSNSVVISNIVARAISRLSQ
ncbi:hypothetical protein [Sphingobacterium paludis]|uniref:Fimbrillin-like protein n=1 Tax=Sphingobacterium paludis TaxID=1476465 RepID=A0A4V6Q028_9SPHI|nr:hypothetical protein [Sphingobacterium paludis]TDS17538.1 hypothetical protein B0I21_101405 [Sphingobacterium paludis]